MVLGLVVMAYIMKISSYLKVIVIFISWSSDFAYMDIPYTLVAGVD